MTALTLAPVQPDESDISAAVEALPHVKGYLATHTDSVIRLLLADDPEETLVVPRGAVELLARVLAHMAAGQGVSVVPAHADPHPFRLDHHRQRLHAASHCKAREPVTMVEPPLPSRPWFPSRRSQRGPVPAERP